jgi:peptidyl-prolyl cis-trans isomerase B (cyclophilin B)
MLMKPKIVFFAGGVLPLLALLAYGCGERTSNATSQLAETNYFEIQTPRGRMVIRLYDETPGHRDNFKKLVAEHAYDSTLFHRVISGFMIQGGDPNSRDDNPMDDGAGGPGYTVLAEIRPDLFHKRGALSAARQGDNVNPDRQSSGSQFYIVQGTIYPDEYLTQMEERLKQMIPDPAFTFSEEARRVYTTEGGAPNLDGMYTVFGELVEGFDVLDDITRFATTSRVGLRNLPPDRPLEPVPMTIRPLPDYQE